MRWSVHKLCGGGWWRIGACASASLVDRRPPPPRRDLPAWRRSSAEGGRTQQVRWLAAWSQNPPMPNNTRHALLYTSTPADGYLLHHDPLSAYLDADATYICTSYNPRCFIIQKVSLIPRSYLTYRSPCWIDTVGAREGEFRPTIWTTVKVFFHVPIYFILTKLLVYLENR